MINTGEDEDRQRRDVADEVHAAGDPAGLHQVDGVEQHTADGPERTGSRARYAIIETQANTLWQLPFFFDRRVVVAVSYTHLTLPTKA